METKMENTENVDKFGMSDKEWEILLADLIADENH